MKQACIKTIDSVAGTLGEVCDALDHLKTIIENGEDDRVEEAMDMFPSPNTLERALHKLGGLIEGRPWEDKRRKA